MMPAGSIPREARRLIRTRALRGFADGFFSVVLGAHLSALGFTAAELGAVVAATMLGSAALTLGVGWSARSLSARPLLLGACALMAATGLGFAWVSSLGALLLIAFLGTLNPAGGDVTVFLPTEQALIANSTDAERRTHVFALYNLGGTLLAALGALASGALPRLATWADVPMPSALRASFVAYAGLAALLALDYLRLPSRPVVTAPPSPADSAPSAPSAEWGDSRRSVLQLAAVFSMDSFASGFSAQTLIALWLFQRFSLSIEQTGSVFFGMSLLSAFGQLLSGPLARRIGLLRTMVYTHLPANLLLAITPFMPNAPLAVACLLARMLFAQMDVPARQSLVMSIVPPGARASAASVTNVPRSLAAGLGPLPAGRLADLAGFGIASFGWHLTFAGALKIGYDLILLALFRHLEPGAAAAAASAGGPTRSRADAGTRRDSAETDPRTPR